MLIATDAWGSGVLPLRMARTCSTGAMRSLRDSNMGVSRGRDFPDVRGANGLRGLEFRFEEVDS